MKKNIYILILIVGALLFSCEKTLDVAPENILQDEAVFSTDVGIEAYLASLYNSINMYSFESTGISWGSGGEAAPEYISEILSACSWVELRNFDGFLNWMADYWSEAYQGIRNTNNFIIKVQSANIAQDAIEEYLAEAKVIRAWYYNELVRLFGGVPLITEVQEFTGDNLADLQVPRNTEKEVYDLILKDIDEALPNLSETSAPGKINKDVALALKSRSMLYAGSSAEFAPVKLDGLVGISSSEANRYYQAAYNAAKAIIDGEKYSLYNANPDKAQNFTDLFINTAGNPEVIFLKMYKYPERTHKWDLAMLPYSQRSPLTYSSNSCPTLEMIEAYEYIDGSDGELKLTDNNGDPIEYKDPIAVFENKDPRFFGTIIYPFSKWRGNTIEIRRGIIDGDQILTSGVSNDMYKGIPIMGMDGPGRNDGLGTLSGFYLRKYLDPARTPSDVAFNSDQDWIVFRYGEILLNYAEAAFKIDKPGDALWAVNEIRKRAGIAELSEINEDKIRHERLVELAFENHRFFDLKRWYVAHEILNSTKVHGLMPYLVYDEGGDHGYIFKPEEIGYFRTFHQETDYYLKISDSEINANPNLVQNPGH
jgi:starch-binding outer membrane protein, SusD/RagB family